MFLYEIVMEYHKRKWSEPVDDELVKAIQKIKVVENRMLKPKKSQYIGEVVKYMLVGLVSVVILIIGYKMVNNLVERGCKTEISKFEIELRGIDKGLGYGARELQSYNIPCKVDKIYFFDLGKKINPEDFNHTPIMRDSLRSRSGRNVFLVNNGEVKRSFYAGNLEIVYPYHICFLPAFNKISFFVEGAGKSAKITGACDQPECTYLPVEISEEDADKLIQEAVANGCTSCTNDKSKIKTKKEDIEIFRKFLFCGGITEVQIILKPKKGLKDFTFYEFLPKTCIDDLRNYLAESLEGDIQIQSDPLIMWHFDALAEEKQLSYKLGTELSNECRELIKGLGVAKELVQQKTLQPTAGQDPKITGLTKIIIPGNKEKAEINLFQYTKYGKDKKDLEYKILQSSKDVVDCELKNNKNLLECERKNKNGGTTIATVQIFINNQLKDSASFEVTVLPKI